MSQRPEIQHIISETIPSIFLRPRSRKDALQQQCVHKFSRWPYRGSFCINLKLSQQRVVMRSSSNRSCVTSFWSVTNRRHLRLCPERTDTLLRRKIPCCLGTAQICFTVTNRLPKVCCSNVSLCTTANQKPLQKDHHHHFAGLEALGTMWRMCPVWLFSLSVVQALGASS